MWAHGVTNFVCNSLSLTSPSINSVQSQDGLHMKSFTPQNIFDFYPRRIPGELFICVHFFGLSRMYLLMWMLTSATMAYSSNQGFPILLIKAQRSLPNCVV